MPQASQDQLIAQIKSGNQAAFQELVLAYKAKAFGLCYSMVGNVEDAQDILQEALVKAYKNIVGFRQGCSFYTWFYAIVANTARDHLRKKSRGKNELTGQGIVDLQKSPADTENTVLTRELNRVMNRAIASLSEQQRLSFVMKHIEGFKMNEIALILHCQPATVKIHLFRAVRNLQKKLRPYLAPGG